MMCRGYYICSIVVMISIQMCADAAPVSDSTDVGERLSGQFLLDLGTDNNRPFFRMLGKIFMNYEGDVKDVEDRLTAKLCMLHPCMEWESWTKCPVTVKGQFGMMKRSRDCNRNDSICANQDSNDWPTEESKVCEGSCPETYNFTNGYCLKLFMTAMTHYDAQAVCENDGGHLVNIDTKVKSDAVHAVLTSHDSTFGHTLWINGIRTQSRGAWQYTYGSNPDFDNWKSGEPTNGSTELCKCESNAKRQWYDLTCSNTRYFFCEVA